MVEKTENEALRPILPNEATVEAGTAQCLSEAPASTRRSGLGAEAASKAPSPGGARGWVHPPRSSSVTNHLGCAGLHARHWGGGVQRIGLETQLTSLRWLVPLNR